MHEDYKRTLMNEKQMRHKMRTIRSVKHKLQSFEINKISLSCFDDKRYILNDGINRSASIHLKQDIDPFYFPKYRPPYFWNKI